jgi:hypothetical protein
MIGFNGGLIGKDRNTIATQQLPGVWTLGEQIKAKRSSLWPVAGEDVYVNNVSLLLRGNGTDGSTTFVDSSLSPKTITAVGNAQISTAQSKFGGASMLFDGNGDYLQASYNSSYDFGTGDFTVELWIYRAGNSTGGVGSDYEALIGSNASGNSKWTIYLRRSTKNIAWFGDDGTLRETSGATISDSAWYHVAWCRSGSTLRGFIDGTQRYSATATGSYTTGSEMRIAYDLDANRQFYGYIDDLRITKGVARYTANFTPPGAL